MIVNLRGTNGSGKSTVARALIGQGATEIGLAYYATPRGETRRVVGYRVPELNMIVVGPYKTACGGTDAIKTQDLICESVRLAAREAQHVFFEGLLVSGLFSRYLNLSNELKMMAVGGLVWAYLDTSLEECLRRVYVRNGGKPIKEDLVAGKHRAVIATRTKAEAAGERTVMISTDNAITETRALFT